MEGDHGVKIFLATNLGLLACFSAWKAVSMVFEEGPGEGGPEEEAPEKDLEKLDVFFYLVSAVKPVGNQRDISMHS